MAKRRLVVVVVGGLLFPFSARSGWIHRRTFMHFRSSCLCTCLSILLLSAWFQAPVHDGSIVPLLSLWKSTQSSCEERSQWFLLKAITTLQRDATGPSSSFELAVPHMPEDGCTQLNLGTIFSRTDQKHSCGRNWTSRSPVTRREPRSSLHHCSDGLLMIHYVNQYSETSIRLIDRMSAFTSRFIMVRSS